MSAYPQSHHAANAELLALSPTIDGTHHYDICVIGAGFTGVSTALHLAELGHKVALVEAQRIGWGASGRNGGQLGYGMPVLQPDLVQVFSEKEAERFWNISVESIDLFHELCRKHKIDCDFKSGNMACAVSASDMEYLQKHADMANSYGPLIYESFDATETKEISGSNRYRGSILSQKSGHLNPLKYVLGLARAAKKAGVTIYENSPATKIEYSNPAKVKFATGDIIADYVVLGCNGYLGKLDKKLASRILPVDNYQATTEVLSQSTLDTLIKTDTCIWDTSRSVHYFRITPDRRLVMGCAIGIPGFPPRNLEKDCRKHIEYVYPQLKGVGLDFTWAGTLGGNNKRLPDVGKLAPNILFAQGFSGHGVGLAPLVGKYMANVIESNSDGFDFLTKVKHKSIPGGRHLRIPAILCYRFMTNTLDMLTAFRDNR